MKTIRDQGKALYQILVNQMEIMDAIYHCDGIHFQYDLKRRIEDTQKLLDGEQPKRKEDAEERWGDY